MGDAGPGVLREDVLVAQDVVDAGLHEQLESALPLDEEVEDLLPPGPVGRGGLVGEHGHGHPVTIAEHLQLGHELERVAPTPAPPPELLLGAEGAALGAAARGADDGELALGARAVPVERPVDEVEGGLEPIEVEAQHAWRVGERDAVLPVGEAGDLLVPLPGRHRLHELGDGALPLPANHEVHAGIVPQDLLPAVGRVHVADHRADLGIPRLGIGADHPGVGLGGGDGGGPDDVGLELGDLPRDVVVRDEHRHGVVDLDLGAGCARLSRDVDHRERHPRSGGLDHAGVVRRRDEQNAGLSAEHQVPSFSGPLQVARTTAKVTGSWYTEFFEYFHASRLRPMTALPATAPFPDLCGNPNGSPRAGGPVSSRRWRPARRCRRGRPRPGWRASP